VALELCLPLVGVGGAAVLWVGEAADLDALASVAGRLGGRMEDVVEGLVVLRKIAPTPEGFPRRPGVAKKRPLAR
jgi:16S rRNA (guanine527-N7)-methyltransferase